MDEFNRVLSGIVDSTLGLRSKLIGYQYSEIIRSLMCVYFCGDTCIEDLSKHLIPRVSQHPKLRTCSSDTILRAIEDLPEGQWLRIIQNRRPEDDISPQLSSSSKKRGPILRITRPMPIYRQLTNRINQVPIFIGQP